MFAWWGRAVTRLRWWVLAATAALVAIGGLWGAGVFGALTGGGFDDPDSESSRAVAQITREFGHQETDLLVLYAHPRATVDHPDFAGPVMGTLAALRQRPEVASVVSYFDTNAPSLMSTDRRATYAAIRLRDGDLDAKAADLEAIRPALAAPGGVTTEVGGLIAFFDDANRQIESDITRAEMLSLPILLVLLILIFRGVIAALTPLLVGVVSILGALTATRLLAGVTDVSVFAVNIITMLGLGMGIDYALFVVSRFREELRAGHTTEEAIRRTMATAGRTVVVSGVTVALALASLLLFPLAFLRSMGFGGMAAVLVAMLAALTSLPALLAVLGPKINAWSLRRTPKPDHDGDRANGRGSGGDGAWARLATSVMRRPVLYAVGVAAVLVAVALPFARVEFGGFDERVLPEGTASRTVAERIATDFPGGDTAPITVLVTGATTGAAQGFADRVAAVPDVTRAQVTANRGTAFIITVGYDAEPTDAEARDVVRAIRGLPAPDGAEVLVGGRPAAELDQLDGLRTGLPWQVALVAGTTLILLFLAFGSVVLPVKAVLMNAISIGASFGVVVWVFQDGHLADLLGFTSTGFLEPTNLVLMLAILFGLSTDYEVFLLSRVREEWDRTGDNRTAVAAGLQRTGGIITAAALLLIVVIGGFATGGASTIKMLGVGTLVAVAVDAALVRTLLVPATMRLLGRWNWWAPGPLARVYRRYGLRESDGADQPAPESRTAAPVG
jgi:RND superfamily putative drug exporter